MRRVTEETAVGVVSGLLTVIALCGTAKGDSRVMAKCACGTTKDYAFYNLKNQAIKSCGCIKAKNVVPGEVFGRLTVIRQNKTTSRRGKTMVDVMCSCGNSKTVRMDAMKSGNTSSCGCWGNEQAAKARTKHGLYRHPLYTVWECMISRCEDIKGKNYKDYGGRGVNVCEDWRKNFKSFYDFSVSHGWRKGLQIDRINNDLGYSPDNCRFVTQIENVANVRLIRADNKTGFRGVGVRNGIYYARANFQGHKLIKRGFSTATDAARYRDRYCLENGIKCPLNFREGGLRHEV